MINVFAISFLYLKSNHFLLLHKRSIEGCCFILLGEEAWKTFSIPTRCNSAPQLQKPLIIGCSKVRDGGKQLDTLTFNPPWIIYLYFEQKNRKQRFGLSAWTLIGVFLAPSLIAYIRNVSYFGVAIDESVQICRRLFFGNKRGFRSWSEKKYLIIYNFSFLKMKYNKIKEYDI